MTEFLSNQFSEKKKKNIKKEIITLQLIEILRNDFSTNSQQ